MSSLTGAGGNADWPGWLGPRRDGRVDTFQPPADWPKQLNRRWQIDVGTGYGSPLVAGDHVYLHSRQGDDEVAWSIDRASGKVVWRESQAVSFKIGGGGERHGNGPKSCPTIADGRLFTMSIGGTLMARDAATGRLLWQRNYDDEFKERHPYWGVSTSPIVDRAHVIIHFGSDEEGALVALEAATGKEVWRQGKAGPSYSSPLVVDIDGVRQVVEWNHEALVGVDRETGRLLWEQAFPHVDSNQNMPTPTFHDGCILLGAENRGIHSFRPRRSGDTWTVKRMWSQDKLALDMSSAVINQGRLFGMSHYDKGRLFCLDPVSGGIIWTGPPRTGENVMFLSFPGHIAALVNTGELRIVSATGENYQPVASYRVSDQDTWAPPVLVPNGVLVKDEDTLAFWRFN